MVSGTVMKQDFVGSAVILMTGPLYLAPVSIEAANPHLNSVVRSTFPQAYGMVSIELVCIMGIFAVSFG